MYGYTAVETIQGEIMSAGEGLEVSQVLNGDTLITGWIADQAALYGPLNALRDLGQALASLRRLDNRERWVVAQRGIGHLAEIGIVLLA
jgi:hypothetical protein